MNSAMPLISPFSGLRDLRESGPILGVAVLPGVAASGLDAERQRFALGAALVAALVDARLGGRPVGRPGGDRGVGVGTALRAGIGGLLRMPALVDAGDAPRQVRPHRGGPDLQRRAAVAVPVFVFAGVHVANNDDRVSLPEARADAGDQAR